MRIVILLLISGVALASEDAPNQLNSHAQRCASMSLAIFRLESQGELIQTVSQDEWTVRFSWWSNLLFAMSDKEVGTVLSSLESSATIAYDAFREKISSRELAGPDIHRGYSVACEQVRRLIVDTSN